MRNKSFYLATTALALLSGTGAAHAGDIYVSVLGGMNFQPGNSGSQATTGPSISTTFNSDPDTGYIIGGAIGAHLNKWVEGLRAEVEVSYRHNKLGGHWHTTTDFSGPSGSADGNLGGKVTNFALMANVWYDLDVGSKFRPYVGGGAGWVRSRLEANATPTATNNHCCTNTGPWASTTQDVSGFAWQLGAGVQYPLTPKIDVGIGYRYFRGPSFDPLFIGKNNAAVPYDNENNSVSASVTFAIN